TLAPSGGSAVQTRCSLGREVQVGHERFQAPTRNGDARMRELATPAPPTLRLAEIVRFDSPTSMAFAERVGAELSGHSIRCGIHGYDGEPMPAANGGHVVLVFPIRGDERMPDQVEAWIRSVPGGTTHSLWVTGDFRTGEPCDRVAADEASRLLSERGSLPLVP